jgi:RsiW-degrading membrane proteinase PrsW (M82 family)
VSLKAGHTTLNWGVGGAFATAVILHALWDTFANMRTSTLVKFLHIELISVLIALVSLTLLIRRVCEASDGRGWRSCGHLDSLE